MRAQLAKTMSDADTLAELVRVADLLQVRCLTTTEFDHESTARVSSSGIERRFGSWADGLRRAGLELSPKGRRWTEDDYFENLLVVWNHYGRPPTYAEIDRPPSRITGNGYAAKFGTWGRAKAASWSASTLTLRHHHGRRKLQETSSFDSPSLCQGSLKRTDATSRLGCDTRC